MCTWASALGAAELETNMTILTIKATTTDADLDAIPYLDMREHAREQRNMAAAVLAEQGDQDVLEYHQFGGADVLYSPTFSYAYVNGSSPGTGNSLLIESGLADSAEHAARIWRGEDGQETGHKYTHDQIAADFRLWGEYVDPDATMLRDEFDAMTVEQRVKLMKEAFGD